jgi:hypothetical protein
MSARRGWAAVCTSTLMADVWIPEALRVQTDDEVADNDEEGDEEEEEEEEEASEDDQEHVHRRETADASDAEFMFPEDDGDNDDVESQGGAAVGAKGRSGADAGAGAMAAAATSDRLPIVYPPVVAAAAAKTLGTATATTSWGGVASVADGSANVANGDPPDHRSALRPAPRFASVGPHSARFVLANGATAVSCDGDKVDQSFNL